MQIKIIKIFINLTAASSHALHEYISMGLVKILKSLIKENNPDINFYSLWALGNFAADEIDFRPNIIDLVFIK